MPIHGRISRMARDLDVALRDAVPIAQVPDTEHFTLAQAYAVQRQLSHFRLGRGESKTGLKLAFTNRKTMARLGVERPVSGSLFSGMKVEAGGMFSLAGHIRPRVEPELAFLLARPLRKGATEAEAFAAIEAIAPALEIVDSRYRDFRFSLTDVVADNTSGCGYVIGAWQSAAVDFGALPVVLEMDDQVIATGSTAAILEHPIQALRCAADLADEFGEPLQAGSIVLAGSATDPVALHAGARVRVSIESLGSAGFSVAA